MNQYTSHVLRKSGKTPKKLLDGLDAQPRFELKQQWEGAVSEVFDDSFTVILRDLSDPSNPEEQAELFLDDVSEDDRNLLEPGAIFYWSIGYEDTRRGRERKSIVRFRRIPGWSQRELENVDARKRELSRYLSTESGPNRS